MSKYEYLVFKNGTIWMCEIEDEDVVNHTIGKTPMEALENALKLVENLT